MTVRHPKWHEAMRRAQSNRMMARYAMPASLRPTFALLARCAVESARRHRLHPERSPARKVDYLEGFQP